ncbi:MAG: bifunctional phosphopantothenoylcysteine decarboxylase/phosphopantothenate--cysteine ligase CoaBC [Rhodospirillales bacterium]|nr:bifunctional phosphopantothenoylcysteine decarboxylase/phosphopantothenate--cysteine ligase CoaBC [Rhodospirillales bacterium]
MSGLRGKRILLVIAGGIAAYKCLLLIRRLREHGAAVRCILTAAGTQFVTPLSVAALSEDKVYSELFSLTDEHEMGHIRLSREADLVVVAPATADLLARMSAGIADDLASTALLATDKPVLVAPAMNVRMWQHPATQANLATLKQRGVVSVGPNAGEMACGEWGPGRMAEAEEILAAIEMFFSQTGFGQTALVQTGRLAGVRALVTSGPTREPIDPVRYISNHSSGRQGHAIAAAIAGLGADTVLVCGPTALAHPPGVTARQVETASEMLCACEDSLPVDVAVCAAAVSDWRVVQAALQKMKKTPGAAPPVLELTENPDILATLSGHGERRPRLVIGFAAETTRIVEYAHAKRIRKGCDWIVANDVSTASGTFGGEHNTVHLITADGIEDWPPMSKHDVAARLALRIADALDGMPR